MTVQILRDIPSLKRWRGDATAQGRPVGFVPTMGFLHAGHQSLMRAAVDDGCALVVSIFVNPLQFGAGEDLEAYPRDEAGDLRKISEVSPEAAIFLPTVEGLYPPGFSTRVHVSGVTEGLCGERRPGHFEGVATVVARFFGLVAPDRAYFGQKDYQQLATIKRMVRDLALPVEVVGIPTVREPDGLALSSRNIYLTPEDRRQALALSRGLGAAEAAHRGGERDPARLLALARRPLSEAPGVEPEYVEIRHAETLGDPLPGEALVIAMAARVGRARLIDNRVLEP